MVTVKDSNGDPFGKRKREAGLGFYFFAIVQSNFTRYLRKTLPETKLIIIGIKYLEVCKRIQSCAYVVCEHFGEVTKRHLYNASSVAKNIITYFSLPRMYKIRNSFFFHV